jgi:hypothetical protein
MGFVVYWKQISSYNSAMEVKLRPNEEKWVNGIHPSKE